MKSWTVRAKLYCSLHALVEQRALPVRCTKHWIERGQAFPRRDFSFIYLFRYLCSNDTEYHHHRPRPSNIMRAVAATDIIQYWLYYYPEENQVQNHILRGWQLESYVKKIKYIDLRKQIPRILQVWAPPLPPHSFQKTQPLRPSMHSCGHYLSRMAGLACGGGVPGCELCRTNISGVGVRLLLHPRPPLWPVGAFVASGRAPLGMRA